MSLKEYSKKRDFQKTSEPRDDGDSSKGQRFVVQRHDASHLHYDLRLEIDGTLKSWAVPKGPSMQPKTKRLAIQTEDHPLSYLNFEGTIPKGNYGAGNVQVWDIGEFEIPEKYKSTALKKQWKDGNLKIIFKGEKLKGEFALVKTSGGKKDNQWLLIKKKDQYSTDKNYDAEDAPPGKKKTTVKNLIPGDFVKPMLASAKEKIFNDPGWVYELKWDGYRMLASVKDGKVQTYSRNGYSFNKKFSKITTALADIPHDVILDGEVVTLDKKGVPNFQALQNYPEAEEGDLRYYVFDILFLNGHSTVNLKLTDRKSLIPAIVSDCEDIHYCHHVEGMGRAFYKKAIASGMEGVIAKKAGSVYSPGHRSENWLKIKAVETQEAIICGYTDAEADTAFGSLILGIFKKNRLTYIGNCGSGFSNEEQKKLKKKFDRFQRKTSPFSETVNLKGRKPNWLTPKLIAEVKFSEWTKTGKLRHPIFKAIRNDKEAEEIQKQKSVGGKSDKKPVKSSGKSQLEVDGISVPFSNLEKVFWPESGFRKYDLIDYYLQMAGAILPYLKDRPQSLRRQPNGIADRGFYQKDMDENLIKPWMDTAAIQPKSNAEKLNYLLCQNKATLLYMANLGCIEIHPWNSRVQNLDNPDYTILDLDPTAKNTFDEVIEVAQTAKALFDELKMKSFCKTSGSRGLHIYLPLGANYSYEEARNFTKLLCHYIQERLPKLTTLVRTKKKRQGRIYLDYLQNRKGQTVAAPYCVRPKKEAPVSTPLHWEEVKKGLKITDFTIKTVPGRFQQKGDLFQGIFDQGITIENILNKLDTQSN